jgi:hypothetical protein
MSCFLYRLGYETLCGEVADRMRGTSYLAISYSTGCEPTETPARTPNKDLIVGPSRR